MYIASVHLVRCYVKPVKRRHRIGLDPYSAEELLASRDERRMQINFHVFNDAECPTVLEDLEAMAAWAKKNGLKRATLMRRLLYQRMQQLKGEKHLAFRES